MTLDQWFGSMEWSAFAELPRCAVCYGQGHREVRDREGDLGDPRLSADLIYNEECEVCQGTGYDTDRIESAVIAALKTRWPRRERTNG